MNDFGGDHGDMARAFYGTRFSYEDVLSDLEAAQRQRNDYEHALSAVVSALEDGAAHLAHEIASKALGGK